MPMTDPFRAQQVTDLFRHGLGNYGGRLDRSEELDALLDRAEAKGWEPAELGRFIAERMPERVSSVPGLVLSKLRAIVAQDKPREANQHALDAMAKAGRFMQPQPPCGNCDGTPARWRQLNPEEHGGRTVVDHCPTCWTEPPGYVHPTQRNRYQRSRL